MIPAWRFISMVLGLMCLPAAAAPRAWTLPDGRQLRATMTGIEGGKVQLLPHNGKATVSIPTAGLIPEDRSIVDAWVPEGRRAAGSNAVVRRDAAGWPTMVALREDPSVTVVEENRERRRFVYRSDHFEFVSSQRLNGEIVREFSRLFEVTYESVAALPLGIHPEAPRGWFRVQLYATEAEYEAAGAPPASGGLFRGSTGEVMVPLPNLGVKQVKNRWIMDNRDGNQPLIHEVTHQVMGAWLSVLPVWFVEGSAEYLAAGRCANGKLTLHADFDNLAAFLHEQKGIAGRDIDLRHPQRLMIMSHDQWAKDLAGPGGIKNYYSAMLTFYYFCHADGDGSGRNLIEYCKARVASLTPSDDRLERDRYLLRGRSWETLWQEMIKAFAARRYRIR